MSCQPHIRTNDDQSLFETSVPLVVAGLGREVSAAACILRSYSLSATVGVPSNLEYQCGDLECHRCSDE